MMYIIYTPVYTGRVWLCLIVVGMDGNNYNMEMYCATLGIFCIDIFTVNWHCPILPTPQGFFNVKHTIGSGDNTNLL